MLAREFGSCKSRRIWNAVPLWVMWTIERERERERERNGINFVGIGLPQHIYIFFLILEFIVWLDDCLRQYTSRFHFFFFKDLLNFDL